MKSLIIFVLSSMAAAQGADREFNLTLEKGRNLGVAPVEVRRKSWTELKNADGTRTIVYIYQDGTMQETLFSGPNGVCPAGKPWVKEGNLCFTCANGACFKYVLAQEFQEILVDCIGPHLLRDNCGRLWPQFGHYLQRTLVPTPRWVWCKVRGSQPHRAPAQSGPAFQDESIQPIPQRQEELPPPPKPPAPELPPLQVPSPVARG